MKLYLLTTIILPFFWNCGDSGNRQGASIKKHAPAPVIINRVEDIPLPTGYERLKCPDGSFAAWLRTVGVKKDRHVYLYNGTLKRNQDAQFVVLDIPVGNKDLQQCADAVMRLRAEYLYSRELYSKIVFTDNNGKAFRYSGGKDRALFDQYLEKVFANCGSASLQKQLKTVAEFKDVTPGDVLIKGGFPGHAMIVMDVAADSAGNRIYLLAQSYMPAQSVHVVKNNMSSRLNPWYSACSTDCIIFTPEYVFTSNQLRRW